VFHCSSFRAQRWCQSKVERVVLNTLVYGSRLCRLEFAPSATWAAIGFGEADPPWKCPAGRPGETDLATNQISALDVFEKEARVSPFQHFSFSSIISTFLKIKMNIQPAPFRKLLLPLVIATALGGIALNLASADIININPIKDNTLYEFFPAEGDLSNALGFHFFAGATGTGELRRGVLAFDIAGNIPAGSTILGVTLSLNMSRTADNTDRTVELHKLLADWGEGTSQAPGEEGTGAPATPNDATWRHRFFDTIFWTTEGGDFSPTISASQSVGALGVYMWSAPQMITDVQSWLNNPSANFGWLVLGNESDIASAKRFDTRESASPPVLTIQYGPRVLPRGRPTPHPRPTPH